MNKKDYASPEMALTAFRQEDVLSISIILPPDMFEEEDDPNRDLLH